MSLSVSFDETTGIDDVDGDATIDADDDAEIGIALATFVANDPEDADGPANLVTLGHQGC